jgi:hypothetical protein
VNLFGGRQLGHRAHWIAVPAVALAFALAAFGRVCLGGETLSGPLFEWVVAGTFRAPVTMLVFVGGADRHVATGYFAAHVIRALGQEIWRSSSARP